VVSKETGGPPPAAQDPVRTTVQSPFRVRRTSALCFGVVAGSYEGAGGEFEILVVATIE